MPGTAVVPPVFSPPALAVAVFDDEGALPGDTDEEEGFQELMGCGRLLPMWMSLLPTRTHGCQMPGRVPRGYLGFACTMRRPHEFGWASV